MSSLVILFDCDNTLWTCPSWGEYISRIESNLILEKDWVIKRVVDGAIFTRNQWVLEFIDEKCSQWVTLWIVSDNSPDMTIKALNLLWIYEFIENWCIEIELRSWPAKKWNMISNINLIQEKDQIVLFDDREYWNLVQEWIITKFIKCKNNDFEWCINEFEKYISNQI